MLLSVTYKPCYRVQEVLSLKCFRCKRYLKMGAKEQGTTLTKQSRGENSLKGIKHRKVSQGRI